MNYLRYANYLGIEVKPEDIKVTLPQRTEEQIEKVNELLSQTDNSKKTIVISPATTWGNKHWDKDNWKNLIEKLSSKYNIVYTGGPDNNELIEYISNGCGINLAGKTNILELAEVFSRADLVLSPDSGSAHLAWATRNPKVIAIFTCTPKEVLGPLGAKDKYVSLGGVGLSCQPCFKRKCKFKTNECTYSPSVENVLEVIEQML